MRPVARSIPDITEIAKKFMKGAHTKRSGVKKALVPHREGLYAERYFSRYQKYVPK